MSGSKSGVTQLDNFFVFNFIYLPFLVSLSLSLSLSLFIEWLKRILHSSHIYPYSEETYGLIIDVLFYFRTSL